MIDDLPAPGLAVPGLSAPDKTAFQDEYTRFLTARQAVVHALETRIEDRLSGMVSRPSVKARVKDFESYFRKYLRLLRDTDGQPPLITDILGVRIVCPFLEDLAATEERLKAAFDVTEVDRKGGDHTFREFGYESIHLLIRIPEDIAGAAGSTGCEAAEVQIRTILQDAWAEVEHELVYKAEFTPFDYPMKRKLAAINASLHLNDIIFQEIRTYQRRLNSQLGQRREAFFRKIEESTDDLLFEDLPGGESVDDEAVVRPAAPEPVVPAGSIDDMLLNALYAHNRQRFTEAIALYTRILEMNPPEKVESLIYKHRGMAHFARSRYKEALADFSRSLEMDPESYKAAYYQGVVAAVTRDYAAAVEAFNTSLGLNPYQPYCLYRRAQAYYHLEDYPQALADCEAALSLGPFEGAQKLRRLLLDKLKM